MYIYVSKICIYLRICIDMGVPRWEWADEGGEMGVGRWELGEGSGEIGGDGVGGGRWEWAISPLPSSHPISPLYG